MHMFPQSQSAALRLHRTVVAAFFALTAGAYAAPDPYAVDTAKPARIDGYKLVWHDEFDVDGAPNPDDWVHETGFVRNHEAQYYRADTNNAFCADGRLVLQARKERIKNARYQDPGLTGGNQWRADREYADYTSASINTSGRHAFKYGRILVRARIPTAPGAWPAIWTLGTQYDWPSNGEMDIMEFYRSNGGSGDPIILANYCWSSSWGQWTGKWDGSQTKLTHFTEKDADWVGKYHVWRMDWTEEKVSIYLDDELLNDVLTKDAINEGAWGWHWQGHCPFTQEHYLLLNLALGGDNGGPIDDTAMPMRYEVDYVRVYQVGEEPPEEPETELPPAPQPDGIAKIAEGDNADISLALNLFACGHVTNLADCVKAHWSTAIAHDGGFRLSRATSAEGPFTTIFSGNGASFEDGGLAVGTTYYYRLEVINGGETVLSGLRTATPFAFDRAAMTARNLLDGSQTLGPDLPPTGPSGTLVDGVYYQWGYGEDANGRTLWEKSSTDGRTFSEPRTLLSATDAPCLAGCKLEAANVTWCEDKGVALFTAHWENASDYSNGKLFLATAVPGGAATFHGCSRPCDVYVRDMSVTRIGGVTYLVSATNLEGEGANKSIRIFRFKDDLSAVESVVAVVHDNGYRESPHVVWGDGGYYLFTSQAAGWYPSAGAYAFAPRMEGPWSEARAIGDDSTFSSQSGWIEYIGGNRLVHGYRWMRANGTADHTLLPVVFDNGSAYYDFYPEILQSADGVVVPVADAPNAARGKSAKLVVNGGTEIDAAGATDGDYRTAAKGTGSDNWPLDIVIDLGAKHDLSALQCSWYVVKGSEGYYVYTIDTSDDGASWTTVLDRSDKDGDPQKNTWGFSYERIAGRARYVRLHVLRAYLHNNPSCWYTPSFPEVKVFALPAPEETPGDGPGDDTVSATGAVTTKVGGDTLFAFAGAGTITVSERSRVEVLIVGGGGGGGCHGGGGGGAGGVVHLGSLTVEPGEYPVVVGAGGKGSTDAGTPGADGGASSVFGRTAFGGGGGGSLRSRDGRAGGAGGGAAGTPGVMAEQEGWTAGAPGAGTSGQGFSGGRAAITPAGAGQEDAAGGGGAGSPGGSTADGVLGRGGDGITCTITGAAVVYGGGGGGGATGGGVDVPGGAGGGGTGHGYDGWSPELEGHDDLRPMAGEDGVDGLGGGGGGGGGYFFYYAAPGGDGGDGVVIVRVLPTTAPVVGETPHVSGISIDGGRVKLSIDNAVKGTRYGYRFAETIDGLASAETVWLEDPASLDGALHLECDRNAPSGFFRIVTE